MDGWMDGRMGGWMGGWLSFSGHGDCDLSLSRYARTSRGHADAAQVLDRVAREVEESEVLELRQVEATHLHRQWHVSSSSAHIGRRGQRKGESNKERSTERMNIFGRCHRNL